MISIDLNTRYIELIGPDTGLAVEFLQDILEKYACSLINRLVTVVRLSDRLKILNISVYLEVGNVKKINFDKHWFNFSNCKYIFQYDRFNITFVNTIIILSMKRSISSFQDQRQKVDTIRKTRFFYVIDNRASNVTIKNVYEAEDVSHDTDKIWLKQRKRLDVIALRHIVKFWNGQFKKMNVEWNAWFAKKFSARSTLIGSCRAFDLNVAPRTLRAVFNQRHPRASLFKKATVSLFSNKINSCELYRLKNMRRIL